MCDMFLRMRKQLCEKVIGRVSDEKRIKLSDGDKISFFLVSIVSDEMKALLGFNNNIHRVGTIIQLLSQASGSSIILF